MAVMRPDDASTKSPGRETIEEVFLALESPLLSYAMRLTGEPELAEDVVQDAVVRALARVEHFEHRSVDGMQQYLRESVRNRIGQVRLPEHVPDAAAFLDVQGGAFFVREGDDRYRFAHKSFLEYFLARALVRTLPQHPEEALTTRPLTQEVASFVGELLKREGDPRQALALRGLLPERELSDSGRGAQDSQVFRTNALRLLRRT